MKKHTILVVDDEEIILETLGSDLQKKGYDVTLAENGEKAVEKLKVNNYDVTITDLMMEGIDGIEVLKNAKESNPDAKVIILTGYGSIETAIGAVQHGASDYILKPYNKTDMFLRIANCIEKLELQRKVKIYENMLPVCCKCKKIRDDTGKEPGHGEWMDIDVYLIKKANVDVTHGYCNECNEELMMEIDEYAKREGK